MHAASKTEGCYAQYTREGYVVRSCHVFPISALLEVLMRKGSQSYLQNLNMVRLQE